MTAGEHFRLVAYGGGTAGAVTLPTVYPSVTLAVEVAEGLLAALADRPHRRPHSVHVQDVWTRETIARIHADTPRDPDVCVACGQPNDPFAQPGGTGSGGADAGSPSPSADAPPEP